MTRQDKSLERVKTKNKKQNYNNSFMTLLPKTG